MATTTMTSTCTPVHFGFAHLRTPALAVIPAGPRRCSAGLLDLPGATLGDHVACEGLGHSRQSRASTTSSTRSRLEFALRAQATLAAGKCSVEP